MSIKCFIKGHQFTQATGIFQRTPYCLRCGQQVGVVKQDSLDKHEKDICQFITGNSIITRSTTVKAMFDAMKEEIDDMAKQLNEGAIK